MTVPIGDAEGVDEALGVAVREGETEAEAEEDAATLELAVALCVAVGLALCEPLAVAEAAPDVDQETEAVPLGEASTDTDGDAAALVLPVTEGLDEKLPVCDAVPAPLVVALREGDPVRERETVPLADGELLCEVEVDGVAKLDGDGVIDGGMINWTAWRTRWADFSAMYSVPVLAAA